MIESCVRPGQMNEACLLPEGGALCRGLMHHKKAMVVGSAGLAPIAM